MNVRKSFNDKALSFTLRGEKGCRCTLRDYARPASFLASLVQLTVASRHRCGVKGQEVNDIAKPGIWDLAEVGLAWEVSAVTCWEEFS